MEDTVHLQSLSLDSKSTIGDTQAEMNGLDQSKSSIGAWKKKIAINLSRNIFGSLLDRSRSLTPGLDTISNKMMGNFKSFNLGLVQNRMAEPKKLIHNKYMIKKQEQLQNKVKLIRQNQWATKRIFLKNKLERLITNSAPKGGLFGFKAHQDAQVEKELENIAIGELPSVQIEQRKKYLIELASTYLQYGSLDCDLEDNDNFNSNHKTSKINDIPVIKTNGTQNKKIGRAHV